MAKLKIEHLDDYLLRYLECRASLNDCLLEEELNFVLRQALGKEITEISLELTPEERAKSIKEMFACRGFKIPPLSDEAISRKTIYGERG